MMKKIGPGTVKNSTNRGTFLETPDGLVLVLKEDQVAPMNDGEDYLLLYWLDSETNKLRGTEKVDEYITEHVPLDEYKRNQKLTGYVYEETDLGFKVFFDNLYSGLVYKNEVFKKLSVGEKITVYVKTIREDNRIDLSIQPLGYKGSIKTTQEKIMDALLKSQGKLNLSDTSSPEDIKRKFGISKKKFKEAIGALYKQRKIIIEKNRIRLP
ncbi:hypothetical protein KC717_01700 [Candidatus Dojkabacteria bacterium]|uniref:S1 motif domain-containing protein n=1 Tax=Candidatus Dojkabacteria bacterium TaxID=2099670 RepID=A0A955L7P1_9BACT|nr:hypothetical protein [Candidatus Dojkabacteria bacterium]